VPSARARNPLKLLAPSALAAAATVLTAVGTWGCATPAPEDVGRTRLLASVGSYVDSSCSTQVVLGLSRQIAEEVDCMMPGTLASFTEGGGVSFTGSAVLPYLAPSAKADLLAAVAARGGTLEVNSAYRTVAQQYLLYRWWQQGRCGITAAAAPGNSNHETGRALDVNNYGSWIGALGARGWSHDVPGDPVHFDHLGSPDLRGADVLGFQRLWNRNHADDRIAEDGDYGPATAARLAAAPAGGFAAGACAPPDPDPDPDFAARARGQDVPAEVTAGDRAAVWVELENTGTVTWRKASTRLGTTMPRDRDSAFFDAASWIGPNRPTGVDHDTAPGEVGRFSFILRAPAVPGDTVVAETFGLVEEGATWFGPRDLTVEVLVHPAAGGGPDPGGGGGHGGEDTGEDGLAGGCAVGGRRTSAPGAGVLALLCLLAAARRRK